MKLLFRPAVEASQELRRAMSKIFNVGFQGANICRSVHSETTGDKGTCNSCEASILQSSQGAESKAFEGKYFGCNRMSGGANRTDCLSVSAYVMETCALFSHSGVTDCVVCCLATRDGWKFARTFAYHFCRAQRKPRPASQIRARILDTAPHDVNGDVALLKGIW